MPKAFFALCIAALAASQYACSLSGSSSPDSTRLETAVASTLTVLSSGDPRSHARQKTEKPGAGQADDPATHPAPPAPVDAICIAYTDQGNVWIREGENPPRQLSDSGGATRVFLSSDGSLVTYLQSRFSGEDVELRVVNVDGSGNQVILDQTDFDSLYPLDEARHFQPGQIDFLSGTHLLLFNTQAVVEGADLPKNDDLFSYDVDTGSLDRLLERGRGGDFYPSPAGTLLAIIRPTSIGFADADGTNLRPGLMTFPEVKTYSDTSYYPEPIWASDSSHLAVVIPSRDPLAPDPTSSVWFLSEDGSSAVQMASIDGQSYFPQAFGAPVISPGLNRIAILRPGMEQNEEHLIITDEDGDGEMLYTAGDLRWIGWAPDGSAFAYSLGPSELNLGQIEEPPQPIGTGTHFRWINSQDYLFLTGSGGNWNLMRGTVGATMEVIAQPSGNIVAYDFIVCNKNTE